MVHHLISYQCRQGNHKQCDQEGCTCQSSTCHLAAEAEPTPIGDQVESEVTAGASAPLPPYQE